MATINENATFQQDVRINGNLTLVGTLTARPRSELAQEALAEYPIPLTSFRVWDAIGTNLGTAAADDLGISGGTFGTNSFYLTAGDLKAAGATTRRARAIFALPPEYDAGQTVNIRISAGMATTIADTSCTVDVEIYVNGRDGTIDGSDLVTTAATTMNSLTFSEKTFVVTATALVPGDELDIRVSITCTDAATGTVVEPRLGEIAVTMDIKG